MILLTPKWGLSLFQRHHFELQVRELKAESQTLGSSIYSWDQFVAMLFCPLAPARSLRAISDGQSWDGKLKHLGLENELRGFSNRLATSTALCVGVNVFSGEASWPTVPNPHGQVLK